jgi:hypothetical protein
VVYPEGVSMKKIFLVLSLLAAALGQACRVEAQFIGYVGLQTTQQALATNLLCTGTAQTFQITNLGQTQHYLSIADVVGAQQFQAEIDGLDRQGNVFRISDVMEIPTNFSTKQGTLFGAGYYPQVQVVITCSPTSATFTASYSGTPSTFNGDAGSYLTAQIDKVSFAGAPAGAAQTDIYQTPFGSSAGSLFVSTTNTNLATLTLYCLTNQLTSTVVSPFSADLPFLGGTTIAYSIPDTACPFVEIIYSGPGGPGVLNVEYVFAVPGLSNHATSDPCQSGSTAKTSTAVIAAAGTTQILAVDPARSWYVCGYQFSESAAGTAQWEYGSGALCAGGTVALTGAMPTAAGIPFTYNGPGYVIKVPFSNALCMVATGGTVAGIVTTVLAP